MKYSDDEIKRLKDRIAKINDKNEINKDDELLYFLIDYTNKKQKKENDDVDKDLIHYYNALQMYNKSKPDVMIKTEDGSISLIELKNMIKDEIKEELKQEISGDERNESKNSFLNSYYNSKKNNIDVDNLKMLNLNNDFDKFKSSLFASAGAVQKTFEDYSAEFWKNALEKWKSEVSDVLDIQSMEVSTTLGEYLKEKGMSQTWLAEKIGVNRATIINIIKNPNSVSYLNAKKIATALGVDVEEIFPCK